MLSSSSSGKWPGFVSDSTFDQQTANNLIRHRGYKTLHYENMSMQHTAIFHGCKNGNFQLKMFDFFHIFAQNIDCGTR